MKQSNLKCEGKVEIISKNKAIIIVDKDKNCDNCKKCGKSFNDVITVVANNEIGAKMGDKIAFSSSKRGLDIYIKVMYFAPLLFLLAGFLFALKFDTQIYQLIFAVSLFLIGTLLSIITICVLKYFNRTMFKITDVLEHNEIVEHIENNNEEKIVQPDENEHEEVDNQEPVEQVEESENQEQKGE